MMSFFAASLFTSNDSCFTTLDDESNFALSASTTGTATCLI
uniref:Uncharacterized protein n=1 Tax=Arundo donax TaxID=35708 RepID=A0A0A9E450_ARUDO